MKDTVHPYIQLFPNDESGNELSKTELETEDFTSDLDEEIANKVQASSSNFNSGTYNSFWEEFERFNKN